MVFGTPVFNHIQQMLVNAFKNVTKRIVEE